MTHVIVTEDPPKGYRYTLVKPQAHLGQQGKASLPTPVHIKSQRNGLPLEPCGHAGAHGCVVSWLLAIRVNYKAS
jgi:hypothetical protein